MSGKHADQKSNSPRESVDEFSSRPANVGERRTAIATENKAPSSKKAKEPIRNRDKRVSATKRTRKRRGVVDWIITILAELLITVGLVAGLFLLWKFVIIDNVTASAQSASADSLIKDFTQHSPPSDPELEWDSQNPPVLNSSDIADGEHYGVLYIPRLDPNYKRVLAQGTTTTVLAAKDAGVGHYNKTQMPGDYGNFALAGHRNTVFKNLKSIVPGDRIYVQTKDGYYTYEVQAEHSIVKPSAVEVVSPVPGVLTSSYDEAKAADSRVLTLTTCWPEWSNTERLIVHANFVEWQPLEAGAPSEIAGAVG